MLEHGFILASVKKDAVNGRSCTLVEWAQGLFPSRNKKDQKTFRYAGAGNKGHLGANMIADLSIENIEREPRQKGRSIERQEFKHEGDEYPFPLTNNGPSFPNCWTRVSK